jgi:hypothetical protein
MWREAVASEIVEELPLWLKTPAVRRRSRWERWISRLVKPRPAQQGVFRFVERTRRVDRIFKTGIAVVTIGLVAILLAAVPSGRYLAGWAAARARWTAMRTVGLEPDRAEIDADWKRRRLFDVESAHGRFRRTFAEYNEAQKRLLEFAGMDPDHVLLRWGNFDKTVMLASTVFEADDSGRSYRLRPGVRSIWIRSFQKRGDVKEYIQIPDRPETAELVKKAGAVIVDGSAQMTNSWGLRGPEPDTKATLRGIVLGDSYMQGLFVGDDQTPTECLKRDLKKRMDGTVEVLNTGHLGYSPEQYYYSLREYAKRLSPQFVVVSFFANDFAGDMNLVLEGRGGDWDEAKYWLGQIRDLCVARDMLFVYVPAPWIHQIGQAQLAGNYPGRVSNILETTGVQFLDPINEFADALLAVEAEGFMRGQPVIGDPLFNGRIGDGHFSPQGCEVWAERVGRRIALLLRRQEAIREDYARQMNHPRAPEEPQRGRGRVPVAEP